LPSASAEKERVMHLLKRSPLFIGGVALFVFGIFADPAFLTLFNIQNLLRSSSILGTLAVGVTIVMLIREIDLSVGSLMAFTIILAIEITAKVESLFGIAAIQGGHYMIHGMGFLIFFTLLAGLLSGLFNGILVTRLKIQSLITTLGVLYAARALSYIISGGHSIYLTKMKQFHWIGSGSLWEVPIPLIIFLLVGGTATFLLRYTIVGRRIYAIGGNEKAALFAGINTNAWKLAAFAMSGFCAALASLMYSSYLASADPQQAVGYELSAIAIVVLGGTTLEGGRGKVSGTLLAALVLGILNNILELIGLRIWYQQVIIGCIIIAAVMPRYLRAKTN
jgi:ribose/xylose/arabinose/galactoside ABC-type transport system permease subunit